MTSSLKLVRLNCSLGNNLLPLQSQIFQSIISPKTPNSKMKKQVGLILFALVAITSAVDYGRLRQNTMKNYAHVQEEVPAAPMVEEEVAYKPAVKNVVRTPIRVVQEPVASYGPSGYSSRIQHDEIADEQAKSAKYAFGSAIDDGIMDHSHVRQETRDGLKVEGSYAYSDGYFKRVVNYMADENGYRVVSESVEPISETGPKIDLVNGKADVHTQIGGVDNQYSVSASEIPLLRTSKN